MNGTRSPSKPAQGDPAQRRIVVKATALPQGQSHAAQDVAPRPRPMVKAPSFNSLHGIDGSGALAPPRKILSNMPSSVTTRRPASPTRSTTTTQVSSHSSSHEARHTKPAFFTASSYSAPRTTKAAMPDFRRADSASAFPHSASNIAPRSNSPDLFRQTDSPTPHTGRANPILARPSLRETHSEDLLARRRRLSTEAIPTMQARTEYAEKRTSRGSTLSSAGSAIAAELAGPSYTRRARAPSCASPSLSSGLNHQSPEFTEVHELNMTQASAAAAESSTRRMLDYEIRNTSLMAVNAHLEKQTRRQASELKQLRRHAQEVRGMGTMKPLSPDASETLTSDDDAWPADMEDVRRKVLLSDELTGTIRSLDGSIQRALLVSEQLLTDAQRGLAYCPRESEVGLGVRVLQKGDQEDEEEDGLGNDDDDE